MMAQRTQFQSGSNLSTSLTVIALSSRRLNSLCTWQLPSASNVLVSKELVGLHDFLNAKVSRVHTECPILHSIWTRDTFAPKSQAVHPKKVNIL